MLMHGKTCDSYIDPNPETYINLYMPKVASIFGDKGKQCRRRSDAKFKKKKMKNTAQQRQQPKNCKWIPTIENDYKILLT